MPDVPLVVEAVLTDLDGVLIDSTTAVEKVWREWAGRVGVDAGSVLANLHGVRSEDTVAPGGATCRARSRKAGFAGRAPDDRQAERPVSNISLPSASAVAR